MQSIPPVTQSSSVVYTTKVQRGALEAQGYVRASHLGLRIVSSTAQRGYAKLCQIAQTDSTVGLIKTELKPRFPNVSNMSCENDENALKKDETQFYDAVHGFFPDFPVVWGTKHSRRKGPKNPNLCGLLPWVHPKK
jgi:hypothetical protein